MIFYLTNGENSGGMKAYVDSWGAPGSRMQFLFYADLPKCPWLRTGTYIFSDLEVLGPARRQLAVHLWHTLSAANVPGILLNNPSNVLRRHELLCTFADEGINRFRAVRATEPCDSLRFPVFVREERRHTGTLTALLHSRDEIVSALDALVSSGYPREDLLVVEFFDTSSPDGIYRKYSAFRVGSVILPRHLMFSRDWNVKKPDLVTPPLAQEHDRFLKENPHEGWLMDLFQLAGIEYGRIDYSMLEGKPQVWEINTNPTVLRTTPRLTDAFERIDCARDSEDAVPLAVEPMLAAAVEKEEYWSE